MYLKTEGPEKGNKMIYYTSDVENKYFPSGNPLPFVTLPIWKSQMLHFSHLFHYFQTRDGRGKPDKKFKTQNQARPRTRNLKFSTRNPGFRAGSQNPARRPSLGSTGKFASSWRSGVILFVVPYRFRLL